MIERIDWQEIKKLAVFLTAVVCSTLLIGMALNFVSPRTVLIKIKQSQKMSFADDTSTLQDKSLDTGSLQLYQIRDPFTPLAEPDQTKDPGSLAPATSEPAPSVKGTSSKGGKEKAIVVLAGKNYTLVKGQSVGNFKVLDIQSSAKKVIFLHGDVKIAIKQGK